MAAPAPPHPCQITLCPHLSPDPRRIEPEHMIQQHMQHNLPAQVPKRNDESHKSLVPEFESQGQVTHSTDCMLCRRLPTTLTVKWRLRANGWTRTSASCPMPAVCTSGLSQAGCQRAKVRSGKCQGSHPTQDDQNAQMPFNSDWSVCHPTHPDHNAQKRHATATAVSVTC